MSIDTRKLYSWKGLCWQISGYEMAGYEATARCPRKNCRCDISESDGPDFSYKCIDCDFVITLDKPLREKEVDLLNVLKSARFKDAEVINIDGELIKVQREEKKDGDYWIDAKISKNKNGELQLMVLAGSRKDKDKTQLFIDPKNERLAFDQNDTHPREIFAKVIAVFKNSKSEIESNNGKSNVL